MSTQGCIAGTGLYLSGMALPQKIWGMMNLNGLATGTWDPALMVVFASALGTHALLYRLITSSVKIPLYGGVFSKPGYSQVDKKLVLGSILFGVGWSLGGFCPGPTIVANGSLVDVTAMVSVSSLFAGFFTEQFLKGNKSIKEYFSSNSTWLYTMAVFGTIFGSSLLGNFFRQNLPAISPVTLSLPMSAFGGSLIGLAAALFLLLKGKIMGFSGLLRGLIDSESTDKNERFAFFLAVFGTGVLLQHLFPIPQPLHRPVWINLIGSFLTGYGTTLSNGCTSGHGICGISRGSVRSVVATATFFMTCLFTTTLLFRIGFQLPH